MDEYILKSDAINAIRPRQTGKNLDVGNEVDIARFMESTFLNSAIEKIKKMEPAEVVPLIHAEWIKHEDDWGLTYECSHCRVEGMMDSKLCYNCGAVMDGAYRKEEKSKDAYTGLTPRQAADKIIKFGLYHAIDDLPHSQMTVEAFQMAVKALMQKYDYRWHDPYSNDLPTQTQMRQGILCVNRNGYYLAQCKLAWDEEKQWYCAVTPKMNMEMVTAWRLIEPYRFKEMDL